MRHLHAELILAACLAALPFTPAYGQAPSRVFQPPAPSEPAQPQPQAQPATPAAQPQAAQPQAAQPQAGTPAASQAPRLTESGGFLLPNVSLTEMIDILAKRLKINYILDPKVQGTVTVYTYGEVKPVDLMPLLETILRVNGCAMVKVGDLYRIVPIKAVSQLPMEAAVNADPKTLPDDERMVLHLVFLKYTTAAEMLKLINPFLGEGATVSVYEPANLLIMEDNSRSMRRTMQLLNLFDSDAFAGQRVKLFDIANSRPSDLVKELDSVFKAYALSEKGGAVKFIAVDRINTVIAVAPNPGIFTEVKNWVDKLDIPVKLTAGSTQTYVYRLKYGRAEMVSMAIMALYTGDVNSLMALASQVNSGMVAAGMGMGGGMGYGGMGGGMGYGGMGGGMGYGGMGGGMGYGGGGYGGYGMGYGGYGMGGGMGYPGYGNGGMGYGGAGYSVYGPNPQTAALPGSSLPGGVAPANAQGNGDLTGSYLGNGGGYGSRGGRIPHVVPNPFDNTLIIQGSPQEIEQIKDLLRQLDVAPRQVLIQAKIYEVELTGALSAGVESFLEKRDTANQTVSAGRALAVAAGAGGLGVSAGALVLKSHELLGVLTASENSSRVRVVSSPSIIATDSVPATMNVGDQVPVAMSQGLSGVTVGGTTAVVNGIGSQSTGVTLSVMAHVNSSGIITMVINQQVSAPEAPPPGVNTAVQSTSFSNRSLSTQVTVADGDTIAIGGAILESHESSSAGVPILNRIPILGAAFGAKSYNTSRTELIVFLTPRVIYDTTQVSDATDEIRSGLKKLQKYIRDDN